MQGGEFTIRREGRKVLRKEIKQCKSLQKRECKKIRTSSCRRVQGEERERESMYAGREAKNERKEDENKCVRCEEGRI
jgi:hypothetical protein